MMSRHLDEVECPECRGAGPCFACKGKGTLPRVVAEVRSNPEAMASIRRGIADWKAGRVIPWSQLKRKYKELA
jgi:hypothetical protein